MFKLIKSNFSERHKVIKTQVIISQVI